MTTNIRRMFGNLLTTSKFLKVMSAVLVACMLISLTACGTATQQNATQTTTQYEEEEHINEQAIQDPPAENPDSGHWHDEEPSSTEQPINPTEEPSSTEDPVDNPPTGMYSYTVYGDIQLFMDVNIDDYIAPNDAGQEVFRIYYLATDLGWLPEGSNNWDASTSPNYYDFPNGDMTIRLDFGRYDDDATGYSKPQISYLSCFYGLTSDMSTRYYHDVDNIADEDKYITASFGTHYGDIQYLTPYGRGSFMISRDDAIIIAYILSQTSANPGKNPFVNTGLQRYLSNWSSDSQTFVLP